MPAKHGRHARLVLPKAPWLPQQIALALQDAGNGYTDPALLFLVEVLQRGAVHVVVGPGITGNQGTGGGQHGHHNVARRGFILGAGCVHVSTSLGQ